MLSGLANPRQAAVQLMNFGLILSTAFMVCSCPELPPLHNLPLNSFINGVLTIFRIADVERYFGHHRFPVPDCRRPVR